MKEDEARMRDQTEGAQGTPEQGAGERARDCWPRRGRRSQSRGLRARFEGIVV